MFQGLIEHTGKILSAPLKQADIYKLKISSDINDGLKLGDSVAIDGVCLTVVSIDNGSFSVEIMQETYNKTILRYYKTGRMVNLEMPLKMGEPIHGHLVQGHVDFVATVNSVKNTGNSKIICLKIDRKALPFIAPSGSVAVNGISLTVQSVLQDGFTIGIIPETIKRTNLAFVKTGDKINIETDMMARYLFALKGGNQ